MDHKRADLEVQDCVKTVGLAWEVEASRKFCVGFCFVLFLFWAVLLNREGAYPWL